VLQQSNIVEEGLGAPEWRLSLCLLFSWIIIAFILMKGVASSGKVLLISFQSSSLLFEV